LTGAPPDKIPDTIDDAERVWAEDVSATAARIYAVSTRILSVANLVQRSFEDRSRRDGLNTGEMLVLDALRRLGPPYETTPARLKARFFISFAGIGKRIARLEELGYVERRPDPEDGRGQRIRLTPLGLEIVHGNVTGEDAAHMAALADMAPEEVEALGTLLRTLQHGIGRRLRG
jgi:DNA-binding MarR family transcriptional regulator